MHIQVISDIHLEFMKNIPKIEPKADYLFLAGDIGKLDLINSSQCLYRKFMDYVSKNWKHTYVTLGNHEFYHQSRDIENLMDDYVAFFESYENITLLEHDECYCEDYRILGGVLWSHISNEETASYINCLTQIKQKNTSLIPLGIELYNSLNSITRDWIKSEYDPNKKTIIITHYPITDDVRIVNPKYQHQEKEIRMLFTNDLINHLDVSTPTPLICISGHTHHSYDFSDNLYPHVRYISNQKGYPNELPSYKIDLEQVFILP